MLYTKLVKNGVITLEKLVELMAINPRKRFKIPLGNIIGNAGMGYFNTSYNLFNVVYSLAIAGLPIAVAKLVAENEALGQHKNTRKILTSGVFI